MFGSRRTSLFATSSAKTCSPQTETVLESRHPQMFGLTTGLYSSLYSKSVTNTLEANSTPTSTTAKTTTMDLLTLLTHPNGLQFPTATFTITGKHLSSDTAITTVPRILDISMLPNITTTGSTLVVEHPVWDLELAMFSILTSWVWILVSTLEMGHRFLFRATSSRIVPSRSLLFTVTTLGKLMNLLVGSLADRK